MVPISGSQLCADRTFLCNNWVLILQAQGCVIVVLLAIGWLYAAQCRLQELERIRKSERKGNTLAFLSHDGGGLSYKAQSGLPSVSVILPVKGIGEHSVSNWETQLATLYGGEIEYLFIVEDGADPACEAITSLIEELADDVTAHLVIAGWATTCSQKIHNQLAGVAAMSKSSKYVLFLDDDIQVHPGTVGQLVACMEKEPEVFMVTGYPFDIPDGSMINYCFMEYHLPLFIGFSTGGQTAFVWGGCMMMHADDWRTDRYGMATAWKNGGYSDDLILASIAGDNGRKVICPPMAVFLYPLSGKCTVGRYWNYLRRQIFVLETYCSLHNQIVNRALFLAHCYLSWGLVLPLVPTAVHLALSLTSLTARGLRLLVPGDEHPGAPGVVDGTSCTTGCALAWALVGCFYLAYLALKHMAQAVIDLCNALAPEQPPVSLDSIRWPMVLAGMVVGEFMYPLCAVWTFVHAQVEWSGVVYTRSNGKICKVERPPGNSLHRKDSSPSWESTKRYGTWIASLLRIYLLRRRNCAKLEA
ncbi:Glucosylceramide Synthase (UDP-glucose-dependent) [Klebsormidium nitens]|uniref:ceramide glucosyltransferase n=1 Tax=Klebsormidium nitens TaxID=105231 RepID=A0A1Y1I7G7_KLENI|nr:Glucosylceramide Synthase (UDP-glucose-dependent) [Klebsormidium nitens]|eukprot:GAQ86905.1 Glucosylceramide Synthase (UDP-glucose-dependent) [Klebsormidium nitens]